MTLERLNVRLIETKLSADKPGAFSGYGAVFGNVDDGGDVVDHGAFTKSLQEWKDLGSLPKMLLNHGGIAWGTPTPMDLVPVGAWTHMHEDGHGLKVEGQLFALNTERGQYIYEGLKSRALDGLSIGYQRRDSKSGRHGERILTDVNLREVSIVTFPMNELARVSSVKALTIEQLRDLEDALRDAGLSRTDGQKAVSVFKQWLRRDAGEPSGQRDAAAAGDDEMRELLEKSEELVVLDALQGLLSTIAVTGAR